MTGPNDAPPLLAQQYRISVLGERTRHSESAALTLVIGSQLGVLPEAVPVSASPQLVAVSEGFDPAVQFLVGQLVRPFVVFLKLHQCHHAAVRTEHPGALGIREAQLGAQLHYLQSRMTAWHVRRSNWSSSLAIRLVIVFIMARDREIATRQDANVLIGLNVKTP
jgi:hypothetical protein